MNRRPRLPSYRRHSSGQARVTLRDASGKQHDILLGPWDSPESHAEYQRVILEWQAQQQRIIPRKTVPDRTVNELIVIYWGHVEKYYRHPDGRPTSEVSNIRQALRSLRQLYGHVLLSEFDVLALKAWREQRIQAGYARKRINKDLARLKRLFKWCVSEKLFPLATYQELCTLEGLRAGRSEAKESPPVGPVEDEIVEKTLPYLLPPVAAMVRLQQLTGMRPGEVVRMRGLDLDQTGEVWVYRPGSDQGEHGAHKTAWRGHTRAILLGPRAQEVLRPWLRENPAEYLFQPVDAVAAWVQIKRSRRKSKVQPSQVDRSRTNTAWKPGVMYKPTAYACAVRRACQRAGVEPWSPGQLRHAAATRVRQEAGLDVARAVLGHRDVKTTTIYAEMDLQKAAQIMGKIG